MPITDINYSIRQLLEKRQEWLNTASVYAETWAIYNELATQMLLHGPRFHLVELNGQHYRVSAYLGADGSPCLSFEPTGGQEHRAIDQYGSFMTSPSVRRRSPGQWV